MEVVYGLRRRNSSKMEDTMKFNHEAPFRNPAGDVITMKAKVTMHGVVHIECYENSERYRPEDLKPMTPEEYQAYQTNDFE